MPLAVLRWTLNEVSNAVDMTFQLLGRQKQLSQIVAESIAPKLQTALKIQHLIDAEDLGVPTIDDLAAVRGMGWPWNVIARVAAIFASRYRRDGMEKLARSLISPDGFPDRIFQLSVLGSVLTAAEGVGATVSSVRPIGDRTTGPVYRIRDDRYRMWDLWFEAENCWAAYRLDDHYFRLSSSLAYDDGSPYKSRHVRPDLLLVLPGIRAVVIECKFPYLTRDPGYVAQGLIQAFFYGSQLAPAFLATQAFVVGPAEITGSGSEKRVESVSLHICSPEALAGWVSTVLTG